MRTKLFLSVFLVLTLMLSPAYAEKKKAKSKPAPAKTEEKKDTLATIFIKNMGVTKDGEAELFCLDFSAPRIPDLQTIDDPQTPRIFFDVVGVAEWKGQSTYDIKGSMIKQVRTGYDVQTQKLRVVMDLNAIYNYNVEPSYDDRYNLFCVAISARSVR